jgi:hypothetical protein
MRMRWEKQGGGERVIGRWGGKKDGVNGRWGDAEKNKMGRWGDRVIGRK